MIRRRLLQSLLPTFFAALIGVSLSPANAQESNVIPQGEDPENILVIELAAGPVVVKLRPDVAPKHVEQIKTLTRQGFYDSIVFHRVIDDFMAQTGDPTGTGTGGSDLPDLPAEFSSVPYERGTLGMARTADPNSANSQFFITFVPTPFLNGQYTVFGHVIDGMEHVDGITRGEPPAVPDKMIRVRVGSDIN